MRRPRSRSASSGRVVSFSRDDLLQIGATSRRARGGIAAMQLGATNVELEVQRPALVVANRALIELARDLA